MIEVENLTKYYHDLCAVDQISFSIRKGEVLGLLGPNGAGKTTTLRMLTGFLRPSAGTIRVKDYEINGHTLQIKRLLGYLPESAPLYHDMLVYDYLGYVAAIRDLSRAARAARIGELGDLCGINEVMHKPIGELSKGYKQRVGLAQAMMTDPEILVLDEPTSGLDPNQIIEIREIIKSIGKAKTVVLSTHILSEAEATCDRIVIIHRGRIAADDSTAGLKAAAGQQSVIHITLDGADFAQVHQSLSGVEGVRAVEPVDSSGGTLRLRVIGHGDRDLRGAVYRRIKATEWILLDFHREMQTLENIFRELTREN